MPEINELSMEEQVSEFYFQYQIIKDRNGLLGDIASLLGMLQFNIMQLGGVSENSRGFLLRTHQPERVKLLGEILRSLPDIELTALRKPSLRDIVALRHGRIIERSDDEMRTYRFVRGELGVLVDFLGEMLKKSGKQVIGVRGQPRVGKTESIVAASVYANKKWTFVSSTLLRQTMMRQLPSIDLLSDQYVYLIDGAVSTLRGDEEHLRVMDEVLRLSVPVVIEHPDIFVKNSRYNWSLFDFIIELRHEQDDVIEFAAYEQEAARWHQE